MRSMFSGAKGFNSNLNNWKVANGVNFSFMFYGAESFDQDISGWVVSFGQDISGWNVSSGTYFKNMFLLSGMTQYVGGWDMRGVTNKSRLQIFVSVLKRTTEFHDINILTIV